MSQYREKIVNRNMMMPLLKPGLFISEHEDATKIILMERGFQYDTWHLLYRCSWCYLCTNKKWIKRDTKRRYVICARTKSLSASNGYSRRNFYIYTAEHDWRMILNFSQRLYISGIGSWIILNCKKLCFCRMCAYLLVWSLVIVVVIRRPE